MAEDSFMLQAAHCINVINTLNKDYSNSQLFLLVPLQIVFPAEEDESEEKTVCRLACDLVRKTFFIQNLNALLDKTFFVVQTFA